MSDKNVELSRYGFSLAEEKLGKRLGRIKMVREESDYSDFYVALEEDAVRQYETAEYILKSIKVYLNDRQVVD